MFVQLDRAIAGEFHILVGPAGSTGSAAHRGASYVPGSLPVRLRAPKGRG